MKRLILPLACLILLTGAPAKAQVNVHIDLGLPVAPPLVVVQPGIQVVEGFQDEVFFHLGWYWCRRPGGWYRARHPRDRFEPVERRWVPRALVRTPEGRYRNWHHREPGHRAPRVVMPSRPEERRMERREDRREDRREERRDRRDKDHGSKDRDNRGHRDH